MAAAGDRPGAGARRPGRRSRRPRCRPQRAAEADRRRLARHAGGLQADRPGRALRGLRPPPRRERHGQGTGGPGHPPLQPPGGRAVRGGEHGLAQPHAGRKRAVRPRPRRVHRRRAGPQGTAGAGRRRHDLPRRSGRHPPGPAGQAAAGAGARRDPARRRPTARCGAISGSISATHQDLGQRVVEGAFRHDLYFRLITFEIEIPPLRRPRLLSAPILFFRQYSKDLSGFHTSQPGPSWRSCLIFLRL